MIDIRPVTDLRNNYTEISRVLHERPGPIFLTKNGYGDMVVMSMETYAALMPEDQAAEVDEEMRKLLSKKERCK